MQKLNKSANFYLGVLIGIIAVVAFLIIAVSNNSEVKLKNGSPARIVQNYIQTIISGRNDLAFTYLSRESSCTIQDIDRAYLNDEVEIILESETVVGSDAAVVRVSIQQGDPIMMGDNFEERQSFRLLKENGQWKISGIPWPLYDCGRSKK